MLVGAASEISPSERVAFAILAIAALTYTAGLFWAENLFGLWALHVGLLVAFALIVVWLLRSGSRPWVPIARSLVTLGAIFALYLSLSTVFRAIPWSADPMLARLDTWLFLGRSPALWADSVASYAVREFFSFAYIGFLPFLYTLIFLGLFRRGPEERDDFVTGFALTYAISYLGYIFLPARGPIAYHAAEFTSGAEPGFFQQLAANAVNLGGGPHGAFPSLHVGSTVFFCLFDLKRDRARGFLCAPLVVLFAVATVFAKYHYVVDVVAGVIVAVFASVAGPRWAAEWRAARRAASARRSQGPKTASAEISGTDLQPLAQGARSGR